MGVIIIIKVEKPYIFDDFLQVILILFLILMSTHSKLCANRWISSREVIITQGWASDQLSERVIF
jgi:hypothetical protein